MTEIWNAWCLFWGIADAAIIFGLLAVAAWSSMPKRNDKRSKLNKMDLVVAHENNGQVVRDNQHPVFRFSDAFKGLPLRKVEFLCGRGGSVVSVTVKDKRGNLATVDEWAKVLWHMTDEQALAYDISVGRKPNPTEQGTPHETTKED